MNVLHMAELRMERAGSTVSEHLSRGNSLDRQSYLDAVTRIVIAINTIAGVLDSDPSAENARDAARLLWSLGEGLDIRADGQREA